MSKTIYEINEKIKAGKAVVVTAEEVIEIAEQQGYKKAAETVDVVTTGTFGPMCSSGMFINFGHSEPPIRMAKVTLNDVPAYAGLAAVDAYIGATEQSLSKGNEYGGAHVIEDMIAGKDISLHAESPGTDCYPRKSIDTMINKDNVNQVYLFNPRNAYQNYPAATNSTNKTIYTYMGTLLPNYGNITYSTAGQLSPLLNDPEYRTIGPGTRIFFGGNIGYVAWEGTQHNPERERLDNKIPVLGAGTLALIGDVRGMNTQFIRAGVFQKYGITLYVGVGIPIPIIDEDILAKTAVKDEEIYTRIVDKSGKENLDFLVNYKQLRSGQIDFKGKKVNTAPLTSLVKSRTIAKTLKEWIIKGDFTLTEKIIDLPMHTKVNKLEVRGIQE